MIAFGQSLQWPDKERKNEHIYICMQEKREDFVQIEKKEHYRLFARRKEEENHSLQLTTFYRAGIQAYTHLKEKAKKM